MIFNYNDLYTEIYINGKEPSINELVFEIDEYVFYKSLEKNHFKLTRYLIKNNLSNVEKNDFDRIMSTGIVICSRNCSIDSLKEIVYDFEEKNPKSVNSIINKNAIIFSFENKHVFSILKNYISKDLDGIHVNNFFLKKENSALYEIIDFFGVEEIERKCIEFGYGKDTILEKINDIKLQLKLKDEINENINISANKNKRKI